MKQAHMPEMPQAVIDEFVGVDGKRMRYCAASWTKACLHNRAGSRIFRFTLAATAAALDPEP